MSATMLSCSQGRACRVLNRQSARPAVQSRRRHSRCAVVTRAADIQAYVWGAPDGKQPWACPTCHSLLLLINEKTLPYDQHYVSYGDNKPDWFSQANPEGRMPLIKDESNGKFVGGLASALEYLEDKYVKPSIGKVSSEKSPSTIPEADVDGLWQAYVNFAHESSKDVENDAEDARAPLENRLSEVADSLKDIGGKFFGKDSVDATDLVLGPKLNHISVVLKHLNEQWVFPSGSEVLGDYLNTIRDLPSWKQTQYSDAEVIDYFEKVVRPSAA